MDIKNASDCELLQLTCFGSREQADIPDAPTRRLFADEKAIRAAILEVIDSGDLHDPYRPSGITVAWWFHLLESAEQDECRMRFADAVIKTLHLLQSHGLALRIEDYCDRHKRVRMFTSEKCCPDCQGEEKR